MYEMDGGDRSPDGEGGVNPDGEGGMDGGVNTGDEGGMDRSEGAGGIGEEGGVGGVEEDYGDSEDGECDPSQTYTMMLTKWTEDDHPGPSTPRHEEEENHEETAGKGYLCLRTLTWGLIKLLLD